MRLRSILCVAAAALTVAAGCVEPTMQTNDRTLAPRRQWRVTPLAAVCEYPNANLLAQFETGRDIQIYVPGRSDAWLAVQVPASQNPVMLTFSVNGSGYEMTVKQSADSADGADGQWQTLELPVFRRESMRLQKVILPPSDSARWVRIDAALAENEQDRAIRLADVGLYELLPAATPAEAPNDYWLCLGASIQQQSIRNPVFKQMVGERFGHDPVIFNEAVSGWNSTNLLNALPSLLALHPHARYVVIHIGGNNVSPNRPYPGGAERLEEELRQILQIIRDDGRIPILARLSYRAYGGEHPVPPESNGSGPYVENIYDPLIAEFCPRFVDPQTHLGVVDAYGWFREHPDHLSGDGVHVNSQGAEDWNRLWAERAGAVIYRESTE